LAIRALQALVALESADGVNPFCDLVRAPSASATFY
jgi:hypothetical protein